MTDGPAVGDTTPTRLPSVEDFPDVGPNSLAAFGQRASARVIDVVIAYVPVVGALLLAAKLAVLGTSTTPNDAAIAHVPLWLLAFIVLCEPVYETVAIAWRGQTVGKWLLGIRVARYTDGKRPSWGQSALRALLPAVAGAVALILVGFDAVGALLVLATAWSNPLRRGWHDNAGGTIVVRTR